MSIFTFVSATATNHTFHRRRKRTVAVRHDNVVAARFTKRPHGTVDERRVEPLLASREQEA